MAHPLLAALMGRIVKKLASQVVVAAQAVGRYYGLPDGSYEILYAPVDVTQFQPGNYPKIPEEPFRISLVANWNRLKGIDVFIKAAALVIARHPNVEFHLAGAKLDTQRDYADRIEGMIHKLNLESNVHYHGFVNAVPDFLRKMDIHVLSSLTEACPMTVLEGMATGIPIVATDVGGVRELLCPQKELAAGFITLVNDADALASAINSLIENQDLAHRFGANGRKNAEEYFSLEKCVSDHHRIYNNIPANDAGNH